MRYGPVAKVLVDEYLCRQDLDENDLIFGHDFFFSDISFLQYPAIMRSTVRMITQDIERGIFKGIMTPVQNYAQYFSISVRTDIFKVFQLPVI